MTVSGGREPRRVSPRLDRICLFIERYEDTHKYAPGVREVAAMLDLSVSTTHDYLRLLRLMGRVDWVDGEMRTLHVTGR